MPASVADRAWRWYTYRLIDPRDNSIFYIGKGSSNRIAAHEAETTRGVCSKKTQRIKDIWGANLAVRREHIAFFCEEQAAYDHETDLITEIGLDNLTNIMPGGQRAWERRVAEKVKRLSQPYFIWWLKSNMSLGFYASFDEWARFGGDNGVPYVRTSNSFHEMCREVMFNRSFPMIWGEIKASKPAQEVFLQRMNDLYQAAADGCA